MESLFPLVLMIGVVAFVGYPVVKGMIEGYRGTDNPRMICPSCGTTGQPGEKVKGSIAIEIVLWLCFIIPGLIYSIWRLTSKYQACPACGAGGMIGVNTPRGRQLVQKFGGTP